ncbi:MAG: hypothetical protein AAGA99_00060 [Actinomycetota bacterium]
MATSAPEVAAAVVDEIDRSGVGYAILHREDDLAAGRDISDVDLVVDRPAREVVEPHLDGLRDRGIRLVQHWPYDWSTSTLFFVGPERGDGAQVDLAFDPHGRGRYGFLPVPLIDGRVRGDRWWRIGDDDLTLYLLRKRRAKGDMTAVAAIGAAVDDERAPALDRRVDEIFSRFGAVEARAALRGTEPGALHRAALRLQRGVVTAVRLAGRLVRPTGTIIAVDATVDELAPIAADLGRVLRDVRVVAATELPARGGASAWSGSVVLLAGRPRPWLRSLVAQVGATTDPDERWDSVVGELERRARRHLRRH